MINKYQILKYFDETREVNTKVNTYKPLNEDKFLWTIWRSSNVWWCITSVSGEGDVREWIGNQASKWRVHCPKSAMTTIMCQQTHNMSRSTP